MAGFRLTAAASADVAAILTRSARLHGAEARTRYRACLTAALRRVAADPTGLATVDRSALGPGLRSFHIRHSRDESRERQVAAPAHVLFYRTAESGGIEVVRVLHERMEPSRHLPA